MSGAGQFGPLSDITAYAPTVTSLAGLESLVGYRGEAAIGMLGSNFADSVGGLYGFFSVLVALWAKTATGVGQHIDYSEMEGIVTMLTEPLLELATTGSNPIPNGNTHRHGAPYGVFPTLIPDEWVAIAVTDDEEWRRLCDATPDAPWASDTSLESLETRLARREVLEEQVAEHTRRRSALDLVRVLRGAGVAANRVVEVGDQVSDPHIVARRLFPTVTGVPDVGSLTVYGSPWLLGRTPVGPRAAGPRLGADTTQVLTSVAGMTAGEVEALVEQGVVRQS
jgi:benzylsuccinate CoA-transferase BbsF subunit